MSFHSWLHKLCSALASGQRHRRRSLRAGTHRPNLEVLEDRCLLSFSPAVIYPVGSYPQAVVAGDFNNNSVLDLAVANNYSNSNVSVLLGNPDGTFAAPGNYGTGGYGALSIAVGNFDGDGNLDLATANAAGVSGLPGNGDGTFGTASNFDFTGLGSNPRSVAVGDFNGDGLLDLGVVSNTYYPSSGMYYYDQHYEGRATVLLGNGAGGFLEPNTASLGYGYFTSAAVADFNGDAIDELATVNRDLGRVGVLFGGLGGPTFSTGYYNHPTSVAAGDVNGDNAPDLITANNDGTVSVLLGNGLGDFGARQSYNSGVWGQSVAVGDFNQDNMLDIVTLGNPGGGNPAHVHVLLGHGDGTFAIPIDQSLNFGNLASGLAIGDFNGDGLPDVAAATTANSGVGNVNVLINAGGWYFPATLAIKDATVTEGDSGTVAAVFTVTRGDNLDSTVTVNYSTANGGALAGSDYVFTSGTLTLGPGVTELTITVPVKGDLSDEYDQVFYVNLATATGANILDNQGVGKILDNDPPPTITITAKVSTKEGHNSLRSFNFIVTLSAPSEKEVWVNFATADGTASTTDNDYVAKSGTLLFAPGQTSKTISVEVRGDRKKESNETFFVSLTGATNATILVAPGIGEIIDDDTASNGGKP